MRTIVPGDTTEICPEIEKKLQKKKGIVEAEKSS